LLPSVCSLLWTGIFFRKFLDWLWRSDHSFSQLEFRPATATMHRMREGWPCRSADARRRKRISCFRIRIYRKRVCSVWRQRSKISAGDIQSHYLFSLDKNKALPKSEKYPNHPPSF
jgi:hypothetical protein